MGTLTANRYHFQINLAGAAIGPDENPWFTNRIVRLLCLGDGRAQIHQQPLTRHLGEAERGMSRRRLQVRACAPAELHDLHFVVHHNAGRHKTIHQHPFHFFLDAQAGLHSFRRLSPLGPARGIVTPGEISDQASGGTFFLIDLVFLIEQGEVIGKRAEIFRPAQEEIPPGVERVVQRRHHALLQDRAEINKKIAATDQIEVGEGRILGQILLGEDAHVADRFVDLVTTVEPHKKALQPFRRDIGDSGFGVKAVASSVERGIAEVCGKDLDRLSRYIGYSNIARLLPHVLQERDSN